MSRIEAEETLRMWMKGHDNIVTVDLGSGIMSKHVTGCLPGCKKW